MKKHTYTIILVLSILCTCGIVFWGLSTEVDTGDVMVINKHANKPATIVTKLNRYTNVSNIEKWSEGCFSFNSNGDSNIVCGDFEIQYQ